MVAPRQRNTREENKQIKEGRGEELWKDKPHKKCHKDIHARWTVKRKETVFGYKDHAVICRKTKLIRDYDVTAASVHDSRAAKGLARKCGGNDEDMYLDSAYIGTEEDLRAAGMNPIICERGYRGHPLTEAQKESNRKKSKVRCRVEHVFGYMEQSMRGLVFRGVGIVRAKANIAEVRAEAKFTLALPNASDVTEGNITIDGIDVRDIDIHSLRDKIGFIPQKGILFSGTIESNIKFGKPDATHEEMVKAGMLAQATEFIIDKEDDYESFIAQGGSNVSGGQKQRLSIARALIKNPPVLIFDDSFSALDMKTDAELLPDLLRYRT